MRIEHKGFVARDVAGEGLAQFMCSFNILERGALPDSSSVELMIMLKYTPLGVSGSKRVLARSK